MYLAKSGAKRLAVMSRSGNKDEKSQGVVKEIQSLGCEIELLTGDVSVLSDVENAFRQTKARIAGIIQGAMVLRVSSHLSMLSKLVRKNRNASRTNRANTGSHILVDDH